MTYAFTVDVPAPMDQYDTVHAEITRRAGSHVDGMIVHFARSTALGFQVLEIWESKEQCDRFNNEVVGPVIAELAAGQPMATTEPVMLEFEPHGLLLGTPAAAGPMA
jgi:hypothetical protein